MTEEQNNIRVYAFTADTVRFLLSQKSQEQLVSTMKYFLQLVSISEASAQGATPNYLQCLNKPPQLNK